MKRFSRVQERLLLSLSGDWTERDSAPLLHGLDDDGLVEARQRASCRDCGRALSRCRCARPVRVIVVMVCLTPRGVEAQRVVRAASRRGAQPFLSEGEALAQANALAVLPGSRWAVFKRDERWWVGVAEAHPPTRYDRNYYVIAHKKKGETMDRVEQAFTDLYERISAIEAGSVKRGWRDTDAAEAAAACTQFLSLGPAMPTQPPPPTEPGADDGDTSWLDVGEESS